METIEETQPVAMGALGEALGRNRKQIRDERARSITRTTKAHYRQSIETLALNLAELQEKQEALLDVHPDNAMSLLSAKTFKSEEFVATNKQLAKDIFETEQVLSVYTKDFVRLFGEEPNITL